MQDIGFLARNVRSQRGVIKRVFFAIFVTFDFTFVVLEWMTIYITRSPPQMKTGPVLGVPFPTTSPTRFLNQRLRSKTAPMWPAYLHPLLLMFQLEFMQILLSKKCFLINTRSLRNKVTGLQLMVDMDHFPIIALTDHETWLNSNYLDCELGLHDYNMHRHDRKSGRGRGVLLAVHKDLVSTRRMPDLEQDSLEILFCEIQQRTRDGVLFNWSCLSSTWC